MTAPLLTPLESAIFDEDVIAEMEGNLDDTIQRERCESVATLHVTIRCCGESALWCGAHWDRWRYRLLDGLMRGAVPICGACKHRFPEAREASDIARVVPL